MRHILWQERKAVVSRRRSKVVRRVEFLGSYAVQQLLTSFFGFCGVKIIAETHNGCRLSRLTGFHPKGGCHALLNADRKTADSEDGFASPAVGGVLRNLPVAVQVLNPELVKRFQQVLAQHDEGRFREP